MFHLIKDPEKDDYKIRLALDSPRFPRPIILASQRYIRKVRVPILLNDYRDYSSYTILGTRLIITDTPYPVLLDSPPRLRDLKGGYPLAVIANAYLDIAEKVLTPEYRLLLFIAEGRVFKATLPP
ncbi:hypothetical protein ACRALDRAFT_1069789 [Sodiomyces alcalophilus JCM 7366]|uniref:uncharacterized protein n=1 Tax=Sodiomyces alcalophilus JCM 7366 TaxID=591952 RepID=UPI0039B59FA4